jgi:hypothetical protein
MFRTSACSRWIGISTASSENVLSLALNMSKGDRLKRLVLTERV